VFRPGHVTRDQHGSAAGPLHQVGGVLGVLVLAQVGDDDVGALPGVSDGDGAPMPLSPPVITATLPVSLPVPT
jgi:hypothetical protein